VNTKLDVIPVVAAIIRQEDKILLSRRPLDKHQGGKWEFPGGKVQSGELAVEALKRECQEELGIEIISPCLFESVDFDYGDKAVRISFFTIERFDGKPEGREGQEIGWFSLHEIAMLEFPEANRPVVARLLS
jgi:8-oxo-dGTP diphosphatase